MYNLASTIDLHTQVSSVLTLLEHAVSSPINAKPSLDCLNELNPSTDHLRMAVRVALRDFYRNLRPYYELKTNQWRNLKCS